MSEASKPKGILLTCPCCGEAEAVIRVDLDDLSTFDCKECGNDFTRADVESFVAKWTRVLDWIDTASGYLNDPA